MRRVASVVAEQEKVLVPALVGLEVSEAHELAFRARVVAVAADPDEELPVAGVVVDQQPRAGVAVAPAAAVAVIVETSGGGGGRPVGPPAPEPQDPAGTK
jgi:beta-lactam-binding protein with PASTA domain